jgi:glycopeptide antibiotics resistance protein
MIGYFDIDDIILNMLGCIVGMVLFKYIEICTQQIKEKRYK